jgi:outer membrane protein TolC
MREVLILGTILILVAMTHTAAAQSDPDWTLKDCQRIALERSPLIRAARYGLEALQQKVKASAWAWFPVAKLRAIGTLIPPQGDSGDEPDLSGFNLWSKTELEVYAPLYTFGKISALKRAAKSGAYIGEAAVRLAQDEVVFQVHRAWYGIQLAAELKKVVSDAESLLEKARKHIRRLEEEDSDDFDQEDVFRLRIHEAEVQKIVLENKRLGMMSRAGLRVAMGMSPTDLMRVPDEPAPLSPADLSAGSLESSIALALRKRPELQAAQFKVALHQANVDRRWAQFFPNVFALATFKVAVSTVDQQDTVFSNVSFNAMGGGAAIGLQLTLDYPIKIARWKEAQAKLAQSEEELRAGTAMLRLEVENAWQQVDDNRKIHQVNYRAVRAARSLLVSQIQTHEDGVDDSVSLESILRTTTTYLRRKGEWLRSIYAFNTGVAQLSRIMGIRLNVPVKTESTTEN